MKFKVDEPVVFKHRTYKIAQVLAVARDQDKGKTSYLLRGQSGVVSALEEELSQPWLAAPASTEAPPARSGP